MTNKNKFMDFCAGIGGGRLGLLKNGLECVGYSEIDSSAINTYTMLYGESENNFGDLMKINFDNLPEFDIMIAGFPCQTFSVIGQRRGMDDLRGQVIYGLINILTSKNIPYFILENVKGLVNHNNGNTIKTILSDLEKAGYAVRYKVLNSLNFGVPQMRERVYFVGLRKEKINPLVKFKWPDIVQTPPLQNYLIDTKNEILDPYNDATFIKYFNNKYNKGLFCLEDILKEDYLVLDTRQSDLRLYRNKVPTLRTGRHGILYVKNGRLHKLSGYESLLLQGFPKSLADKVNITMLDRNLLSQAGNAMTVTTIEAIGRELLTYIKYRGE